MERRLAAILAADVVGYSRLMGEDEDGTLTSLKAHLEELVVPMVATHEGRIVKLMGDGVLAEFPSALEAVRCAIEIQRAMVERNTNILESRQLRFRVGVNLGDVVSEGDDIYGDGINVAARLEELAEPGGVALSSMVHVQIQNKVDVDFQNLGEKELKNIAYPVQVFSALLDGEEAPTPERVKLRRKITAGQLTGSAFVILLLVAGAISLWLEPWRTDTDTAFQNDIVSPPLERPSIAVLPFNNMSGEKEHEYFVDGFTEDLITDLSKVSGLAVIARNSVFTYKDRAVDVRQVGKDLGVSYVLEGSIRRFGNQMRFNAQLVDALSGEHVWADRFDRDLEDVFKLQDDVISQIISILKVELTGVEAKRISSDSTDRIDAYDRFLLGQRSFFEFTREGNVAARREYENAIDIDSGYARAVANLGWTYARDFVDGWSSNPKQSLDTALEWVKKAIELNPELPQAYWIKGQIHLFRKEHSEALDAAKKSVELNPNNPDGKILLARILTFGGRPEEGIQLINEAKQLNPFFPMQYDLNLGIAYFTAGNFSKAISSLERAVQRNPGAQRVRMWLAASYARNGNLAEAQWEAEELAIADPGFSIERMAASIPYRDDKHRQKFIFALKEAGLPD